MIPDSFQVAAPLYLNPPPPSNTPIHPPTPTRHGAGTNDLTLAWTPLEWEPKETWEVTVLKEAQPLADRCGRGVWSTLIQPFRLSATESGYGLGAGLLALLRILHQALIG